MTYPEIKLVDSPSASATVLFDFNDITATPKREVHADDFTIGVPELVGDVDAVDPLYGERLVSFTCAMTGTKPAVAAAQSTLSRRLLSGQGWLWVRMTPTSRLLFFRTYRAQPGDLSFEFIQSVSATKAERWELKVNLPCEPFAYGERVTLASQTVNNDPTNATNPQRITLPTILGDAPSSLRLTVGAVANPWYGQNEALIGDLHSGASVQVPINLPIGTGDGLTAGTGTAAAAADTYAVGGSSRAVSFASPALLSRLSGSLPSLLPGRYRVMVRVFASNMDVQFQFSPATPAGATLSGSPLKTESFNSAGAWRWVDLGVHAIPRNLPPQSAEFGPSIVSLFNLSVGQLSAGVPNSFRLDHMRLIPVQLADTERSSSFRLDFNWGPTTSSKFILDADTGAAWKIRTSTGALEVADVGDPPAIRGVLPTVTPGNAHVLSLMVNADVDSLMNTRAMSVVAEYHPRFLYVGDS